MGAGKDGEIISAASGPAVSEHYSRGLQLARSGPQLCFHVSLGHGEATGRGATLRSIQSESKISLWLHCRLTQRKLGHQKIVSGARACAGELYPATRGGGCGF